MKKMFVIVLALIIGLAFATAGFAAEKAKSKTYTGEVIKRRCLSQKPGRKGKGRG